MITENSRRAGNARANSSSRTNSLSLLARAASIVTLGTHYVSVSLTCFINECFMAALVETSQWWRH